MAFKDGSLHTSIRYLSRNFKEKMIPDVAIGVLFCHLVYRDDNFFDCAGLRTKDERVKVPRSESTEFAK